jgi:hypothetical protein
VCVLLELGLEEAFSLTEDLFPVVELLLRENPPAKMLPMPPCLTPYAANLNASSTN